MSSQRKTLFMETTSIDSTRTAGEITSELVKAGATQVSCEYKDGKITGLRWTMRVGNGIQLFTMPARVEHPDWARRIRDLCLDRGIAYHFKQWGDHGSDLVRISKKAAGHLLDGKVWHQFPSK